MCMHINVGSTWDLLKSESKYGDMVDIMTNVHQYVPTKASVTKSTVPGDDEDVEMVEDESHTAFFCGDQMTAARARGSQRIRKKLGAWQR